MQEDEERVVGAIGPVQIEEKQDVAVTQVITSSHISIEFVEEMAKSREAVQLCVEEMKKIVQEFWEKLNTPALLT